MRTSLPPGDTPARGGTFLPRLPYGDEAAVTSPSALSQKDRQMRVDRFSSRVTLGRTLAGCVMSALLLDSMVASGEDLTPEVTGPLQEFKMERLAIEEKAALDTKKQLQTLTRKLEKLSKGPNKNPKVSEQAAAILKEVKDPTFLVAGINRLMNSFQGGVTGQQAQVINLAYQQRRVTADDWTKLPGDVLKVTLAGADTGIDVQPGDCILVCPHPDQKWRQNRDSSWSTYDGGGNSAQRLIATITSENNPQKFWLTRENGVLFECGVKGRLHLDSNARRRGIEGSIDCKVFKITQR